MTFLYEPFSARTFDLSSLRSLKSYLLTGSLILSLPG